MVGIGGITTYKEYLFIEKRLSNFLEREEISLFINFLKENNIDFVISGSSSLYLNGLLDRKPKDLDLNMNEENFNKLKNLKRKNDFLDEVKGYSDIEEKKDVSFFEDIFGDNFPSLTEVKKRKNPFPLLSDKFFKYYYSYNNKYGISHHKFDIFVNKNIDETYDEVDGIKIMKGHQMIKIKTVINLKYRKITKDDGHFHYQTKKKHFYDMGIIMSKLSSFCK